MGQAAIAILAAIGVSGCTPDPSTTFDELDSGLNQAWLSGAVHPVSLRGLTSILLATLPKDTLTALGQIFADAGSDDVENAAPQKISALLALSALDRAGLDSYPDEPIVSVNPAASARQVDEAMSMHLRQWREQRQIQDQRVRSDKFDEYLRVWDIREGFSSGGYDRTSERKLREIAAELGMSVTTVCNHYRSAFALIVGHPYSRELWYSVFGPTKLSSLYGEAPGRVSQYRPLASPTRRDVPQTVVDFPAGLEAVAGSDFELIHLINDIQTLVRLGRTDHQILDELGLSNQALEAVAYLRAGNDLP